METESIDITQKEPLLFRVTELQPPLVPALSRPGNMVMHVSYLNHASGHSGGYFELSAEWYRPYVDAINEAIRSQVIYWVDLDYSKVPDWPLQLDDTVPQRILRAIGDGQVVHGQWVAEEH